MPHVRGTEGEPESISPDRRWLAKGFRRKAEALLVVRLKIIQGSPDLTPDGG